MSDYILLNEVEREKVLGMLKNTKFEEFEVIKEHYYYNEKPRHGISLEKAKEIYSQFNKISEINVKNSPRGNKYTVVYKINKRVNYSLCFFLDENPKKIFNAIYSGRNLDKRVMSRYFGARRK